MKSRIKKSLSISWMGEELRWTSWSFYDSHFADSFCDNVVVPPSIAKFRVAFTTSNKLNAVSMDTMLEKLAFFETPMCLCNAKIWAEMLFQQISLYITIILHLNKRLNLAPFSFPSCNRNKATCTTFTCTGTATTKKLAISAWSRSSGSINGFIRPLAFPTVSSQSLPL